MTKTPSAAIAVVSSLVPAGLALLGATQPAAARITQVVIETTESPTYGGKAFGTVGPPPNGKSFTATVPIAKNPDGSSIVGSSTDEFVIDSGATPGRQRLTYPAATADKAKASLTVRRNYADPPIPLPASAWDYADA